LITRHTERRVVAYEPMQLFELVADVPRYPEFLPWCHAGRIRRRESPTVQIAELAIGFGPFHEKFASRVVLTPDAPDGPRYLTPLQCQRVYVQAGQVLCLGKNYVGGVASGYDAFNFDEQFPVGATLETGLRRMGGGAAVMRRDLSERGPLPPSDRRN